MNFKTLFAIMFASILFACQNNVEVKENNNTDTTAANQDMEKDDFISQAGAKIEELGQKVKDLDVKIERTNNPEKKREYTAQRDSVNMELSELKDNLQKVKAETKEDWKEVKVNISRGIDKVQTRLDTLNTKLKD